MKKLYIFDLDGTLVDAYRAIWLSLNFTRRKLGYPEVSYDEVKRKVGKGDKLFILTFFPKQDLEPALKLYREHHKKTLLQYAQTYPYARWLLYQLKRKGKLVAIASNRPMYYTNLVLKKLNLKKYIDYILCADKIKTLKPDPKVLKLILKKLNVKKEDAVFIGDMDIDLETAKRAGVDAVYVKGGSSSLFSVAKYRNKKVASSLRAILKLFP